MKNELGFTRKSI